MMDIFSPRDVISRLRKNTLIINAIMVFPIAIALAIMYIALFYNSFSAISARLNTRPYYYVHDGVVQVEEAVKMVLKGKNPYTENYFNTPLEDWGGAAGLNWENPALYHLVYLPFNIIFSIPFFVISNSAFGWFDERIVYILALVFSIAAIIKWPDRSVASKILFLSIFIANPWFSPYFVEGRNDIFVLSWIFLSIYFLALEKINYSLLFLALAVASKQTAWFILPFYFAYFYYNEPFKHTFGGKIKKIIGKTKLFFITASILIVPFVLWDFHSFIDDVFKYSSGTATNSYPISAESLQIGFQHLILDLGLVRSPFDYWPFWIPQLIFGLPLLYMLLKLQKGNNTLGQMIYSFFLLLMVFWVLSRFFNNNYLGVLVILLAFALFLAQKPPSKTDPKLATTPNKHIYL